MYIRGTKVEEDLELPDTGVVADTPVGSTGPLFSTTPVLDMNEEGIGEAPICPASPRPSPSLATAPTPRAHAHRSQLAQPYRPAPVAHHAQHPARTAPEYHRLSVSPTAPAPRSHSRFAQVIFVTNKSSFDLKSSYGA
ncbi:hypothetical protein ACOSQ4_004779 [Xanthoceras sorbifolium]